MQKRHFTLTEALYDLIDCKDLDEAKLKFESFNSPSRSAKGMDRGVSAFLAAMDVS